MAGFDSHSKCARCCDKGLGSDPCVIGGAICSICDSFITDHFEIYNELLGDCPVRLGLYGLALHPVF